MAKVNPMESTKKTIAASTPNEAGTPRIWASMVGIFSNNSDKAVKIDLLCTQYN
ncbi:MAG: hypothetical protein RQ732_05700 [Methylophaga sp.]|nr:hypothetical protein [Methylophaga sp.]